MRDEMRSQYQDFLRGSNKTSAIKEDFIFSSDAIDIS